MHKLVEQDFDALKTFSIGEGDCRRTVICYKKDYIMQNAELTNNKYKEEEASKKQTKRARTMPSVGIYRPPAARKLERHHALENPTQQQQQTINDRPHTDILQECHPPQKRGPVPQDPSFSVFRNAISSIKSQSARMDNVKQEVGMKGSGRQRRPDMKVYVPRGRRALDENRQNVNKVPVPVSVDVSAKKNIEVKGKVDEPSEVALWIEAQNDVPRGHILVSSQAFEEVDSTAPSSSDESCPHEQSYQQQTINTKEFGAIEQCKISSIREILEDIKGKEETMRIEKCLDEKLLQNGERKTIENDELIDKEEANFIEDLEGEIQNGCRLNGSSEIHQQSEVLSEDHQENSSTDDCEVQTMQEKDKLIVMEVELKNDSTQLDVMYEQQDNNHESANKQTDTVMENVQSSELDNDFNCQSVNIKADTVMENVQSSELDNDFNFQTVNIEADTVLKNMQSCKINNNLNCQSANFEADTDLNNCQSSNITLDTDLKCCLDKRQLVSNSQETYNKLTKVQLESQEIKCIDEVVKSETSDCSEDDCGFNKVNILQSKELETKEEIENCKIKEQSTLDLNGQEVKNMEVTLKEKIPTKMENVKDRPKNNIKANKPKQVKSNGKSKHQTKIHLNPEECDWDSMFDDSGECLDPSLLEELSNAVGDVSIEKPKCNYDEFRTKSLDTLADEFPHVIEIYNFPVEFKTQDLMTVFSQFKNSGFEIRWVDDTHALGIFSSPLVVSEVLSMNHPFVKTRPLKEGTPLSKSKARKSAEFLQPYRARPDTCAALARRLVTGALGVRLPTSREEREAERKILKEAREKKKLAAKQREEAWEGTFS